MDKLQAIRVATAAAAAAEYGLSRTAFISSRKQIEEEKRVVQSFSRHCVRIRSST